MKSRRTVNNNEMYEILGKLTRRTQKSKKQKKRVKKKRKEIERKHS